MCICMYVCVFIRLFCVIRIINMWDRYPDGVCKLNYFLRGSGYIFVNTLLMNVRFQKVASHSNSLIII